MTGKTGFAGSLLFIAAMVAAVALVGTLMSRVVRGSGR